jgi:hypothetical protein
MPSLYGAQSAYCLQPGKQMLVPPEAVTQKPACPAVFVPQSESVLHDDEHQRSLLQSPTPPSGAEQLLQGDDVLDEHGSPT